MSRPKRCRVCGHIRKNINRKGRCLSCSVNKNIAVIKQLRRKKGKFYKKWRRNLIAALKIRRGETKSE